MPKKRPSLAEIHGDVHFDGGASGVGQGEPSVFPQGKLLQIPTELLSLEKNIRDTFSDESLDELGDSMLSHGQIEPIVVYQDGRRYVVKVGHRRYKAAVLRDIKTLWCIVESRFTDEAQQIITQAIENEQRLNLSSRERESYIARLLELGLSQVEIAKALHKSAGWVSEALTASRFLQENRGALSGLSEEPSTRDVWKASTLSKDDFQKAVSAAVEQGGTKDVFKKEVNRRFKTKGFTAASTQKKLRIVVDVVLDEESRAVSSVLVKCSDEMLQQFVERDIKKFYSKSGYDLAK